MVSLLYKSGALVRAPWCTHEVSSFVVVTFLDNSASQDCAGIADPRLLFSGAGKTPTFDHAHMHAQGRGLRGVRFISLRPVVENPSKFNGRI